MRRKDREVTDKAKIDDIIRRCTCCRLGFYDKGEVYIVPLNFGCSVKDDKYVLYFHGAKEGRKMELISENPQVGFEMDTDYKLITSDVACGCTVRFQSIIGKGTVSLVTDSEEKRLGLSVLMEHNTGKREWSFDDAMVEEVAVFKLDITGLSCKEHE